MWEKANRVAHQQLLAVLDGGMEAEAEQSAAPAEPAPAAPAGGMSPDAIAQLKDLGDLHTQGVLTDEEFAEQKAKLLAG